MLLTRLSRQATEQPFQQPLRLWPAISLRGLSRQATEQPFQPATGSSHIARSAASQSSGDRATVSTRAWSASRWALGSSQSSGDRATVSTAGRARSSSRSRCLSRQATEQPFQPAAVGRASGSALMSQSSGDRATVSTSRPTAQTARNSGLSRQATEQPFQHPDRRLNQNLMGVSVVRRPSNRFNQQHPRQRRTSRTLVSVVRRPSNRFNLGRHLPGLCRRTGLSRQATEQPFQRTQV